MTAVKDHNQTIVYCCMDMMELNRGLLRIHGEAAGEKMDTSDLPKEEIPVAFKKKQWS